MDQGNNIENNTHSNVLLITELMKMNLFGISKFMRITAICTYVLLSLFYVSSIVFYIFKRPQCLYSKLPVNSFLGWIFLLVASLFILFLAVKLHKTGNLIREALWSKKNTYLNEAYTESFCFWKGIALAFVLSLLLVFIVIIWVLLSLDAF
jgi:Protein of unknown function (DUF422).